jgi:NhaP-type Na+/H+ or K+/H+ antiporter
MPSQAAINATLAFLIIVPAVFSILLGLAVGLLAGLIAKRTRRIPIWQMIISSIVGAYVVFFIGFNIVGVTYALALIVVGAVVGAAAVPAIRRPETAGN